MFCGIEFRTKSDANYAIEEDKFEDCEEFLNGSDSKVNYFDSKESMNQALEQLGKGDLYILGRLWVEALKCALVGVKINLVPTVNAAPEQEEVPKRPPKMKYTDLPIYETPHYDFKNYETEKSSCPESNKKIMYSYLYPKVRNARCSLQKSYCENISALKCNYRFYRRNLLDSTKDFKKYMRDPENLALRQGVTVGGALTGYLIGSGGGIPRRLFCTSLGALAAGALCFPKATDEAFRDFLYHTSKTGLSIWNSYCGKDYALRERVPCAREMPPEPTVKASQCEIK